MADDELVGQDEIEKLLAGGGEEESSSGSELGQDDIEALLSGGGDGAGESGSKPDAAASEPIEDADKLLSQGDIEALLGGGGNADAGGPGTKAGSSPSSAPPSIAASNDIGGGDETSMAGEGDISQGDVEFLLRQAEDALNSVVTDQNELPANVLEFQLPEFGGAVPSTDMTTLDLISEVELDVKIELGRAQMYLDDVLKLRRGSVVPLDKLAGDPVDIFVNGRLVARGEVLVMNDNFCVRVAELVAGTAPTE